MAKNATNYSMPVDQPILMSRGIVHREADFFAQDGATNEERGFVRAQLDASSEVGKLNGNRSNGGKWTTPRPLTDGGPFRNLRSSR